MYGPPFARHDPTCQEGDLVPAREESPPRRRSRDPQGRRRPIRARGSRRPRKTPETEEGAKSRKNGKALVIVESPAKAKTINKYLGNRFVVKASMGHVRDLPKGQVRHRRREGLRASYTAIRGKTQVISDLKRLAKGASSVFLAPTPTARARRSPGTSRSRSACREPRVPRRVQRDHEEGDPRGVRASGQARHDKVDAQQARRVLDRIMGYKLSPLLWKKIAEGLSAGACSPSPSA
jgi:DNA topoisomerase-1